MFYNFKNRFLSIQRQDIWIGMIILFLVVFSFFSPYLFDEDIPEVKAVLVDPSVSEASKTKLIWVNDVYYYAFSNSTDDVYDIYLTTSTDGIAGNWSEPQKIFTGIKPTEGGTEVNGLFAFEYNEFGNYFGLAAYASSTFIGPVTGEIWFTSSTDGSDWSATSTIVDQLSSGDYTREIYLDFSKDEEYVAIAYMSNSNDARVSYSVDKGETWDDTSYLNWGNGYPLLAGLGISGSGVSRVLHVGMVSREDLGINYASSTDNVGTSWSTSTVVSDIFDYIPSFDIDYTFHNLVKFSVNDSGLPGFIYYIPIENSGTGPIDTTSTVFYAHGDGNGGWSTSSIMNVGIQLIDHTNHYTSDLFYFNDNIITFFWGENGSPTAFVNTSSVWVDIFDGVGQTLAYFSGLSSAYNITDRLWAGSYVTDDGQLHFVTSSLDLSEPSDWDGNLPVLPDYSKQKLLFVNDVYYLAFTSSTNDLFDIYITTSTSGVAGTWSEPRDITTTNIFVVEDDEPLMFDLEYNEQNSYFALVYLVTSTQSIYFSTSSNAISWSTPTLPNTSGEINLALRGNNIFLAVKNSNSTNHIFSSVYSSNGGMTWGLPVEVFSRDIYELDDPSSVVSGASIGSDDSLHMLFYSGGDLDVTTPNILVYASSTDNGSSWSTTTIAEEIKDKNDLEDSFAFDLDNNNNPGALYYEVEDFSCGELSCDITYTPRVAKWFGDSGWVTTTIHSSLTTMGVDGLPLFPQLLFIEDNYPLVFYPGANYYPEMAISTSTDLYDFSYNILSETVIGNNTSFGLTYNSVGEIAAFSYIDINGQLTFTTTSLSLPEEGSSIPIAPNDVNNIVATSSINFSWIDNSDDEDGFVVEKSTDGINFTIFDTISADVTSTVVTDLIPNTSYVLRVAAFNTYGTSTYATSATDYTNPVVPSIPEVSDVSTSSLSLTWNNNLNSSNTVYYILYSNSDYSTTTATTIGITGLTSDTEYQFQVRAEYLSNPGTYTAYSASSTVTSTLAVGAENYGVTLSNTTRTVAEDSGTATYTIVLDSEPANDVVISISESSADFSISPTILTFTLENWDTPQMVTITATSDILVEGTETGTITHTATSDDENYDGINIDSVIVTITDNDSSSSSGGSSSSLTPSGIGSGSNDVHIGMNQTGSLGNITSNGVNFLGYIGSQGNFSILTSGTNSLQSHSIKINNLDLFTKKVNLIIQSESQNFTLGLNETIKVDLDNDGVKDLEVKFASLWVNRVELTIKAITNLPITKEKEETVVSLKCPSTLFTRNLSLGIIGEDVRALQKYLNSTNFIIAESGVGSRGKETNYFGSLTLQSLEKFQKAKKINATLGSFDLATRNYLGCVSVTTPSITVPSIKYNFSNFLNFGMRGTEIKQLQLRLQELGYLAKDVITTGYFGPLTKQAVIKLQLEHNLQPSAGYVGPGTREILNNK